MKMKNRFVENLLKGFDKGEMLEKKTLGKRLFEKIKSFITIEIWREDRCGVLYSIMNIIVLSVKKSFKFKINAQASALTYYTFFSIIPILSFIIAICRGFGFEGVVYNYLSNSLSDAADMQTIHMVMNMIESYLNHAQGGAFIGMGIIVLLWSVYNVFSQIERSMNDVWEIPKLRPLIRRFTDYFSLTLFIPFITIVSSGFTIYFNYHISQLTNSWFVDFLMGIKPWFFSCLILTLVYMVIPNTKVGFRPAFTAGILAGVFILVFKEIFFMFMKWATSYNAVYGSLAIIPVMLMFFRIAWVIILCGAEISYATQNYEKYDHVDEINQINIRYLVCFELYLLKCMISSGENDKKFFSFEEMVKDYGFPPRLLTVVLKHLCKYGFLKDLTDEKETRVYILQVHDKNLKLGNFIDKVSVSGREDYDFLDDKIQEEIRFILEKVKDIQNKIIENYKDIEIKSL